jgi:hypothetical protein
MDIAFDLAGTSLSVNIDFGTLASASGAFISLGSSMFASGNVVYASGVAGGHSLVDTYFDDYSVSEPTINVQALQLDPADDFLYVKSLPVATELIIETSSNLSSRLIGIIDQIQEIEDQAFQLLEDRALSTAEGEQLDQLGTVIGVERGSLDDDEYRIVLGAQITINTAHGTPEEIISVIAALTNSTQVQLNEFFPASIEVTFNGDPINAATLLSSFDKVVAAGVGRILIKRSATPFGFAGNPDAFGFGTGQFSGVIKGA